MAPADHVARMDVAGRRHVDVHVDVRLRPPRGAVRLAVLHVPPRDLISGLHRTQYRPRGHSHCAPVYCTRDSASEANTGGAPELHIVYDCIAVHSTLEAPPVT